MSAQTGSEQTDLLETVIRQSRRRKRWKKIAAGLFYASMIPLIFSILNMPSHGPDRNAVLRGVLLLIYGCAGIVLTLTRQSWSNTVARLTNTDSMQAVGALTEALEVPDKKVRVQAQAALIRLLPRLRSEDSHLLDAAQRHILYRRLKLHNALMMPYFMIALLDALERVGDAEALVAVQTLAAARATTGDGRRVRIAAEKCLPVLIARLQEQETNENLLRASSLETVAESTLLHPAQGTAAEPPEQLLRAPSDRP